jgi:enamine deaminase RidA (YjgF/YER057c/UK114 family)
MAADRLISSGGPWESKIGYSRAVVAGDYVHVSGSTATVNGELQHKGDAFGQTLVALETVIAGALAQVGYTLNDVVRTRVYLADASDMDRVGEAHGQVFGEIRPAATMLAGIQFINPEMLVEIEVDAWKRNQ